MAEYEEHPSKASSWRDGHFVVLEDATCENCTVWFSRADADAASGGLWEGLLARRLAPDRARICAVPFWLYDVNLGDEVELIESGEHAAVATRVVVDAGAYTFRVIFEGAASNDERWKALMADLECYVCWFDIRSPGYIALSCAAEQAESVAAYLHQREQSEDLRYETGRRAPAA